MRHSTPVFSQTGRLSIISLGALLTLVVPVLPGIVHAQVTPPITSSGLNTQISAPIAGGGKTQYDITGGTRPGGGTNLFHSFGQFNVPANNIANFLNETGLPTSNILGRVTGGNISNIFGTIQTTGFGNANLFLMNPAGFLFGPNATVNVGGMLAFTSADYLRLADGVRFNAIPHATADALLTASPVASFGFLGSNPGAITVQGSQLSVADGMSIALVGGNIAIQSGTLDNGTVQPARLSAPNGQIQLASATSPGEFVLSNLQNLATNVDGASFTSFGLITLGADSTINVNGSNKVSIRGGEFMLSVNDAVLTTATNPASAGTIALRNGSAIYAATLGSSSSGDIDIAAKSVTLNESSIRTESSGTGDAGNITITASDSLSLSNSGITSETNGSGLGGTISVIGRPSVALKDGSLLQTMTNGDGQAGDINLTVESLSMNNGSSIETVGSPSASSGSITVDATGTISLSASGIVNRNEDFGGTGNISLTAGTVQLTNASIIRSETFFGLDGSETPKITIGAGDKVTLSSDSGIVVSTSFTDVGPVKITAPSITITERAFIDTTTGGPGAAGPITLNSHNLEISGGGRIRSSTVQDSGFGGAITVTASGKVSVSGTDSGIFSESASPISTAQGGSIQVSAQQIDVTNGGVISAKTTLAGNAGAIILSANSVKIENGGHLTSSSVPRAPFYDGDEPPEPTGNAGTVTIQGLQGPTSLAQSVLIDGVNSGIFTTTSGIGAGGNIVVNANTVTLQNGATMSASSTGKIQNPGNAGNINITAMNGFTMQNSTITTQAGQGAGGGDIKIMTSPEATVYLQDSTISASVADGPGGGGNISIDPQFVILQNSKILAQAAQGQGGAISITANLFLPDANSIVNADSGSGFNGTVTIQSPNAPASGKIMPLSQKPLIATTLLSQRCAALASGELSSLTVAGRDNLPEPGSWLSTPLALTSEFGGGTLTEGGTHSKLNDSERETPLLSLRQIAPSGFLTQSFAVDSLAGCAS